MRRIVFVAVILLVMALPGDGTTSFDNPLGKAQPTEETLTFTFDEIPDTIQCNQIWQEHGLDLYFTETTADDAVPGLCTFGYWNPGELRLQNSRFVIELGNSFYITQVEVVGWNNCGESCSRIFLYNEENEVAKVETSPIYFENTDILIPKGGFIDRIVVSSSQYYLREIRIISEVAPAVRSTWGTIKTLYR